MIYTFRRDFSDGTFDVVNVEGESIGEARDEALAGDADVDSTTLCGMRDPNPAACLAF